MIKNFLVVGLNDDELYVDPFEIEAVGDYKYDGGPLGHCRVLFMKSTREFIVKDSKEYIFERITEAYDY